MELTQIRRIANSPDFIDKAMGKVEDFHREVKDLKRKPRYFTICVDQNDEIMVKDRFLNKDTDTHTRVFAGKRLTENFIGNDGSICPRNIGSRIHSFFVYNGILQGINESVENLPLLISEETCSLHSISKSRLDNPSLWKELQPVYKYYNEHPVCSMRYTSKTVEMFLTPYTLLNHALGLADYGAMYRYLPAADGLIPHIGSGFFI